MTAIELDNAFNWFQKASGVQVGSNDISTGDPLFSEMFTTVPKA